MNALTNESLNLPTSQPFEGVEKEGRCVPATVPTLSVISFSNEWDKLYAAFTLANGALSMGREVHMFFTFWGARQIREVTQSKRKQQSFMGRILGFIQGSGVRNAPMSKLHFMGLGRRVIEREMKKKNIMPLHELVETALELGAVFHCCETSTLLFGWSREELIDDDRCDVCGAVSMLEISERSYSTLFI